jgi:hypothetical protein
LFFSFLHTNSSLRNSIIVERTIDVDAAGPSAWMKQCIASATGDEKPSSSSSSSTVGGAGDISPTLSIVSPSVLSLALQPLAIDDVVALLERLGFQTQFARQAAPVHAPVSSFCSPFVVICWSRLTST